MENTIGVKMTTVFAPKKQAVKPLPEVKKTDLLDDVIAAAMANEKIETLLGDEPEAQSETPAPEPKRLPKLVVWDSSNPLLILVAILLAIPALVAGTAIVGGLVSQIAPALTVPAPAAPVAGPVAPPSPLGIATGQGLVTPDAGISVGSGTHASTGVGSAPSGAVSPGASSAPGVSPSPAGSPAAQPATPPSPQPQPGAGGGGSAPPPPSNGGGGGGNSGGGASNPPPANNPPPATSPPKPSGDGGSTSGNAGKTDAKGSQDAKSCPTGQHLVSGGRCVSNSGSVDLDQ